MDGSRSFTLAREKAKEERLERADDTALSEKEVNLEKLKDLTEMSITEQKEEFQTRFIFTLSADGFAKVSSLTDNFVEMCESASKGSTSVAYTSADFQKFMKKVGMYANDMQKMEVFKIILDILLDDNTISLIQFLILYYRKDILEQYDQRWANLTDEALRDRKQGKKSKVNLDDDEEDDDYDEDEITTGDKLIEEFFQPPLGVDSELDDSIVKFSEMLSKREQKIHDFVDLIRSSGRVKAVQARTELSQFKARAQDQINKSKIYFAAAIKHVRTKQEEKFKEVRDRSERGQSVLTKPEV